VWVLGMSGILPLFQKAAGTGFWMQVGDKVPGDTESCNVFL
jgi:hypothetical protein